MSTVFAVFHLNLAYSSIETQDRATIIERCYWPLLKLVREHNFPLGIEMSGWTLKEISRLDRRWTNSFAELLTAGKCEVIGSGYCQILGPLVPAEVNHHNQKRGIEIYQDILGVIPDIALVNEMALTPGLINRYREAGYCGIIMDRDNVSLALDMPGSKIDAMPRYAAGEEGASLPVLWSDSTLFQKLQRYVHDEIRLRDYENYLESRLAGTDAPLPLYCNDAEIFDMRPGRYETESPIAQDGEWSRLATLFNNIKDRPDIEWLKPSHALQKYPSQPSERPVQLVSLQQPIPVKKQAKYNISRWAVTGRDDTWLNTLCHRIHQSLVTRDTKNGRDWDRLCELWASDYRTHTTRERWRQVTDDVLTMADRLGVNVQVNLSSEKGGPVETAQLIESGFQVEDHDGMLTVTTGLLCLSLNKRRGLTIDSLAFTEHRNIPTIGTLAHGYFHTIELGADYYSNGSVIELTKEHLRITDLSPVETALSLRDNVLYISSSIATDLGQIVKRYKISPDKQSLDVSVSFPDWQRPYGSVRVGFVTLLPGAFAMPLQLEWSTYGKERQRFALGKSCFHDRPASNLVSCSTGLGNASGELTLGDCGRAVKINWTPAQCAAFPMLHHHQQETGSLTRIVFSLCEVDETFVAGGHLPDFEYTITPQPKPVG